MEFGRNQGHRRPAGKRRIGTAEFRRPIGALPGKEKTALGERVGLSIG